MPKEAMVSKIVRAGAVIIAAAISFASFSYSPCRADAEEPRPERLPSTSLKDRVIWGATCEAPDGLALSFGGEDQEAEDGASHTRLRVNEKWEELQDQLIKANPFQALRDQTLALREAQKHALSRARFHYLEGLPAAELRRRSSAEVFPEEQKLSADLHVLALSVAASKAREIVLPDSAQRIESIQSQVAAIAQSLQEGITPDILAKMRNTQVRLEELADALGAEPPPRALSAIVYEPRTKVFVLFGGDHCDYLTNDTWVFDPASRKWSMRHPASAPPPRANHAWKLDRDGKLVLAGGYTYFSNTDYMGGQYLKLNDGEWAYDIATDTWAGTGKHEPAGSRTYRTGPFLPEFFFTGPPPEASLFQATLKALPANIWTKTNPPSLPQVNRDWGTAVIDPDRDLILRWSGGHCAHGGSDVLEFHLASNRWELCYPVEFPLGQLYSNTDYPSGFNFNHRPWISGHSYQSYGIDPALKKMLFLGHPPFGYVYDPDAGDWAGRLPLPKAMSYSDGMYTLTTTPTPRGLICWTKDGEVFRFDSAASEWEPLHTTGEQLPGSSVDNSTVAYDSRQDRLLFLRKEYGDSAKYDGEIYTLDLKSLKVGRLSPAGKDAANAIPYLCQVRYDPTHDLLLAGATLPPGPGGLRRTPAYDCARNKWVSYKITGDDPSGDKGRNVSLGLMFDASRGLFWAVDARSQVFVLRFDPQSADGRDLGS